MDNKEFRSTGSPKQLVKTQISHLSLSTRNDFQLPRRLFHLLNGVIIGSLYLMFLTYQVMLQIIGAIACLIYITDQLRLSYPRVSQKILPATRLIMRAEEQLKQSAMVPYAIAILLTIITFPKMVAIISIFTLAVADPMSAIVGIRYGGTLFPRVVPHKSLEGSLAFFLSTLFITFFVLINLAANESEIGVIFIISLATGLSAAAFEMLPIKIDDNLTIPLFTGVNLTFWILIFDLNFI